jgi:hypothetical protein
VGDGPDHLFIVTYGRSGSTLLQGILNSTPGVLIRGENRGISYKLHEFHRITVVTATRSPSSRSPPQGRDRPWRV